MKVCMTVLRYNVDKTETPYAQFPYFARKKEEEEFQQIVHVNYKLDEFIYLLDVVTSVNDKNPAFQPICIVF